MTTRGAARALAVLAIVSCGAVGVAAAPGAGGGTGKLRVREHRLPSDVIYTEGYVSFLRIREAGSGRAVVKRRFQGRVHARTKLRAGRYRVIRFIRPCDGNCGLLDPRTERCAAAVDVGAGGATRVVIRTRTGTGCKIRVKPGDDDESSALCPAGEPHHFDAQQLVGMRLAPAEALAERFGCLVRVVRLDGEWQIVTDDYRTDRVNVWVEDDVVTRIDSIG